MRPGWSHRSRCRRCVSGKGADVPGHEPERTVRSGATGFWWRGDDTPFGSLLCVSPLLVPAALSIVGSPH